MQNFTFNINKLSKLNKLQASIKMLVILYNDHHWMQDILRCIFTETISAYLSVNNMHITIHNYDVTSL